jgi:hypothetical protein
LLRLASFCRYEAIVHPIASVCSATSFAQPPKKHQVAEIRNNLAAERTGIRMRLERY